MQEGFTPLYVASQYGRTSVVNLLLDKGAAVDLLNKVRMISQVRLKPCVHYVIRIIILNSLIV